MQDYITPKQRLSKKDDTPIRDTIAFYTLITLILIAWIINK